MKFSYKKAPAQDFTIYQQFLISRAGSLQNKHIKNTKNWEEMEFSFGNVFFRGQDEERNLVQGLRTQSKHYLKSRPINSAQINPQGLKNADIVISMLTFALKKTSLFSVVVNY